MKTREFTATHMALCIGGFFAVIIAVNITLAVFANKTWSGLIVNNGYVASQEYNDVLANAAKQASLGWKSDLAMKDGRLGVDISDQSGGGIEGLAVRAKITRPTHENEDMEVTFSPGDEGAYVASPALAAGQWVVDLTAETPSGIRYRRIFRLVIGAKNG